MSSQDVDNLDDLADEPEAAAATAADDDGAQVPEVKVTVKPTQRHGGKNGKAGVKVENEDALKALQSLGDVGTGHYKVERETPAGPAYLGIELSTSDLSPPRLCSLLGKGSYWISHGKNRVKVTLATLTPPKEFGEAPAPPVPAPAQGQWVYTPQGHAAFVPPGVLPPPGTSPNPPPSVPFGYGYGQPPPWGQPTQDLDAKIAKAIADALKPFLDKRGDADVATQIALKRIDLEIADRAATAKKAEAEADRAVRLADVAARRDADLERARAEVAASKERVSHEGSMFDKMLNLQGQMEERMERRLVALAPKEEPDEFAKIDRMLSIATKLGKRDRPWAEVIMDGLPAILDRVRALPAPTPQPAGQPQQLPAPAAAPAQSQPPLTPEQQAVNEFFDVLATVQDAIKNGIDPSRVVPPLKQQRPLAMARLANWSAAECMATVETLIANPANAHVRAQLESFRDLVNKMGKGWLEEFFKLARA